MDISANHSHQFCTLFMDQPENYFLNRRIGIITPEKISVFNNRVKRKLITSLESIRNDKFIISAEGISSFNETEFSRMISFIKDYTDSIKVVAYVRDPQSFVKSNFQQGLKQGGTFKSLYNNIKPIEYKKIFNKVINVVGKTNLILQEYDRSNFYKKCVVLNFLKMIDAPKKLIQQIVVADVNQSISMKSAQLLSIFNEHLIQLFSNQSREIRKRFRNVIEEICNIEGEAFHLKSSHSNAVVQASRADIEWLNDEFEIFFCTDPIKEETETNYVPDDSLFLNQDEYSKISLILLKKVKQLLNQKKT